MSSGLISCSTEHNKHLFEIYFIVTVEALENNINLPVRASTVTHCHNRT